MASGEGVDGERGLSEGVRGIGAALRRWLGESAMSETREGPERKPDPIAESTFAFESAVRYQPDTREPGYYLNNGDDWPDGVSATEISADALLAVVSRFPAVYKSAMALPEEEVADLK